MDEPTGDIFVGEGVNGPMTDSVPGDAQVVEGRAAAPVRRARGSLLRAVLPIIVLVVVLLVLPMFIPSFLQSLVTKMMIFSIFAMSMNILWGYANIPTFGHAVFFGAGGYAAGILIFHAGISNFWLNLLLAVLFAAAVAALLGFPAFRVYGVGAGNTNPIYFLLVTLAFGEIASRIAIFARSLTGGSTGMAGIPYPDLGMGLKMTPSRYYYLVFVFAVVCIYLMYRIENSHYGYGLRGIHDNERRMQALGYNTWLYKYTSWVIAGAFGGVAGVLFAYFGGVLTPNSLAMQTSEIGFMAVILGGAALFAGPIVGVVAYVGIEYLASLYLPDRWPLILGAMFVVVIMLMRQGLGPMLVDVWRRLVHGSA
jgi:branched-chain amino acid transport system permease protein